MHTSVPRKSHNLHEHSLFNVSCFFFLSPEKKATLSPVLLIETMSCQSSGIVTGQRYHTMMSTRSISLGGNFPAAPTPL